MNTPFNMKAIQAQWVLGIVSTEQLPDIAIGALSAKIESKSLIVLSGLSRTELSEAQNLFERALNELGYENMDKAEALKVYAKTISSSITKGEIAPLEGAKRIWQATIDARLPSFHDLDTFIYAASELEDRPQDRILFEKAIIDEATRWA